MGQVRIKKGGYNWDVPSQLLIFKNEIGTNISLLCYCQHEIFSGIQ